MKFNFENCIYHQVFNFKFVVTVYTVVVKTNWQERLSFIYFFPSSTATLEIYYVFPFLFYSHTIDVKHLHVFKKNKKNPNHKTREKNKYIYIFGII